MRLHHRCACSKLGSPGTSVDRLDLVVLGILTAFPCPACPRTMTLWKDRPPNAELPGWSNQAPASLISSPAHAGNTRRGKSDAGSAQHLSIEATCRCFHSQGIRYRQGHFRKIIRWAQDAEAAIKALCPTGDLENDDYLHQVRSQ